MALNIRKILLPTDFSASSERAIEHATTLARGLNASVHLVHVLDGPSPWLATWHPGAGDQGRRRERQYQDAKLRLATVAQRLLPFATAVSDEVRTGDAASEIVKAAGDYGCDLVVMATHGRSGLSHLVLGSVAEAVIRRAPCPVLAVRQPDAARVPRGRSVA